MLEVSGECFEDQLLWGKRGKQDWAEGDGAVPTEAYANHRAVLQWS